MLVCASCGHRNASEGARFCGKCGKPLGPSAPPLEQVSPGANQLDKTESHHLRKPSRMVVGIVALLVCAAVAAVGVAVLHRSSAPKRAETSATVAATKIASAPVPNNPPAPASNSPAAPAASSPAEVPAVPVETGEASTPPAPARVPVAAAGGVDIVALNMGGAIESITGQCGPGPTGNRLIDGWQDPSWQPEGYDAPRVQSVNGEQVTVPPPPMFPQDIVFSYYQHETALISSVVMVLSKDSSAAPRDVEIWTSNDDPDTNFTKVSGATRQDSPQALTISLSPPVQSRYLKIRVLSGLKGDALQIAEIQAIEAAAPGYVPLLQRHPDIANWPKTPIYAAQRGIEWLETASTKWQSDHQCFGCHVQGQVIMGFSVAKTHNYVVSAACTKKLVDFITTGDTIDRYEPPSPLQYAAMALAYYDQAEGNQHDASLLKAVDDLTEKMSDEGEVAPSHDEPPIDQGSFMTTGNTVFALMEAYAEAGSARYAKAADRGLNFLASSEPVTNQDKVFKVIALSRFGTPEQRQIADQVARKLVSEQNSDGGWRTNMDKTDSNALPTGQVLYAFKQAGVSVTSNEFARGVAYLLKNQQEDGSWPPDTNSGRPSQFIPTMWAVIGLAGSFGDEQPTADALKTELDKKGRVSLYINFDFNKATIRPDGKPIIAQVVKLMKDNPELVLSVNGHTDNVGSQKYNLALSRKRAAAVVDAVVESGVPRGHLSSGGFGSNQPIAENDTEKGRAKNRRVELVKM
jgi:outer membrane protein OmpA-like peptidoglycan-associated protein